MTTYTDRQKACIKALQDAFIEISGGFPLTDDECAGILAYLESTSPVAEFSEATAEPIYQRRKAGLLAWHDCTYEQFVEVKGRIDWSIRALYPTASQPAAAPGEPVALSDEMIAQAAAPAKPITKEWCMNMAKLEPEDGDISAGAPSTAAHAGAMNRDEQRLALWNAINAIKFGSPTDDKVLLDSLHKLGFVVSRFAAPTPVADSGAMTIRFDFINADGREDSKVISHDEMRERYAAMYKAAHQNFAAAKPVSVDAGGTALKAPEGEDPMRYGDRSIEASVKRLTAAYVKQQAAPIPDQMALVWRFDIGCLRNDWIRLNAWQKSVTGETPPTESTGEPTL